MGATAGRGIGMVPKVVQNVRPMVGGGGGFMGRLRNMPGMMPQGQPMPGRGKGAGAGPVPPPMVNTGQMMPPPSVQAGMGNPAQAAMRAQPNSGFQNQLATAGALRRPTY